MNFKTAMLARFKNKERININAKTTYFINRYNLYKW